MSIGLPKKLVENLCKEISPVIRWVSECYPDMLVDLLMAYCETLRTCKTEPMTNFFKPFTVMGVDIPEHIIEHFTMFTQETENYIPTKRSK